MDVEQLKQERTDNLLAVLNNTIPKRVPISLSMGQYAVAEYGKKDPCLAYWDISILEEAVNELCELIPTDVSILGRSVLNPSKYQALASKAIKLGNNGFIQHPNTHMMEPDEYDEFIEDPYAFVVEKAAPRVNANLDINVDPGRATMAIHQATQIAGMVAAKGGAMGARISAKFGYPQPFVGASGAYAPMDILSDQLRSFSGISTDIRRYRSKVAAAIEAISPLNYKVALPADPANYSRNSYGFYPLHMATFMRIKDFEELWWPAFKRQWNDLASFGYRCGAFLEDDWTNLLDYVQDLPTGSVFTFEYGDPKIFKQKLGKKFLLSSGFPVKNLTQCTKEEVIDKTKEWLDAMAPDGNYMFGLDKSILTLADCNIDNLKAVAETVLSYGVYDNPGTKTGEIFNKEDYTHSNLPEFSSRQYKTWEQYKEENSSTPIEAKNTVMAIEDSIVKFYYSLLQ